jgi:2-oxoglutarate/2-oxoacid ferredoxin oxidoreductase subunit beta
MSATAPVATASPSASAAPAGEQKLTKKILTADHPTWCPGCGDFAVLASFYKVLEKLQYPHEKIVCVAGIGCSSRFPYFVNSHGIHFIHGRALPLATGISLSRPDLHVSSSAATATASRSAATTSTTPPGKTSGSPTSSWTTTSMA